MALFLGIDGGGTRTTAGLADERGRIVGRGTAGPSNPLKVGFENSQREILRAARGALKGAATLPLDAVVLGLAGTDRPPVHRRLSRWLARALPARRHLLTSDAAIALHAAIGDAPGIMVISGTGSIAVARDAKGKLHRAGGWGTLFDDRGSGYELGRKGLVAALFSVDGRGRQTSLLPRLTRALKLQDITRVVFQPPEPRRMAALASEVSAAAARGDAVARQLLDEAGRDLAALALALARRLGWQRRAVPIVCAGGLFRADARIRRTFARELRRSVPRARIILLDRPAVEGALAMARQLSSPGTRSRKR